MEESNAKTLRQFIQGMYPERSNDLGSHFSINSPKTEFLTLLVVSVFGVVLERGVLSDGTFIARNCFSTTKLRVLEKEIVGRAD